MAIAITGLVASCCSGQAQTQTWEELDASGPGTIVTLTGTSDGFLIGRDDPTADTHSILQWRHRDGRLDGVALAGGATGHAHDSRLLSVSTDGTDLVALGGVRAGAHGNVRWTVWRGSTAGLTEQPQPFETFGGWDAGMLTGTAISHAGPIIVGTWVNPQKRGLDVTTWEPRGARWVQPRSGAVSAATATKLPSPGAVSAAGGRYQLAGWVTRLAAPLRDEPVVWSATDPAGPWRELPLPVPGDQPIVRAVAIDCTTEHCIVAGRSARAVIVWRVLLRDGRPDRVDPPQTVATSADPERPMVAVAAASPHDVVAFAEGGRTRTIVIGERSAPFDHRGDLVALATDGSGQVMLATREGATSHLRALTPRPARLAGLRRADIARDGYRADADGGEVTPWGYRPPRVLGGSVERGSDRGNQRCGGVADDRGVTASHLGGAREPGRSRGAPWPRREPRQ